VFKQTKNKVFKESFTLIELLVVIAIIGVLVAFVMPSISNARAKARDARRVGDLGQLRLALEMYYSDYGHYPIWESDCIENESASGTPFWGEDEVFSNYMKRIPQDPLYGKGYCYYYKSANNGSDYHLVALLETGAHYAIDDGGEYDEYYEVLSTKNAVINTTNKEEIKTEVVQAMGSEAQTAVCGNGQVEPGEECDDGDDNSDIIANACRTNCKLAYCGDDVVDTGEECDQSKPFPDGLTACSADTCQITPGSCSDLVNLSGLVAYWKLDAATGDVIDSAGGNNNGTNNGATRDVSGRVGQAFSFDGNDYVKMSASNLPITEKTMEAWFYTTDAADQSRYLLGYGGGPNGTSWYIYFPAVSDKKTIILTVHWGVMVLPYDSPVPLTNAWHYVAATTDPTGSKLYLDGQLVASNTEFVDYTVVSGKDAFIGSIPDSSGIGVHGSNHWDGLVDEVAIYNEALNVEQISQHYQNGLVGKGYCQP